jgi:tryptophanase
MNTREEREIALKNAHYNLFNLTSDQIYIDLLTDSGTSAMSDHQWAGMMRGDESYAGCRGFFHLEESVKDIFDVKYVIPTHQGRAAESIIFGLLVKPGQYVLGNMHFDSTRGHIELAGGIAIDCVVEDAYDTSTYYPFKGNIDNNKMEEIIKEKGAENIACINVTITCNSCGGQPVSMTNFKEIASIANKYGIKLIIDAARCFENAYFIKTREKGYENKSIKEITKEMFSYADAFTMSSKKDGLVNIGGLIGVKQDEELAQEVKRRLIIYEGFITYGGLAGRDLEALAIGLQEGTDFDYLAYRVGQVQYLGERLREGGIAIQWPVGGHAVFVDAKRIVPHIPYYQFPAQALVCELYLEAGIRAVEVGSFLVGTDINTGEQIESAMELMRLTIPRRVYTRSHMDVIADAMSAVKERANTLKGFKVVEQARVMRHFTAKLMPIE